MINNYTFAFDVYGTLIDTSGLSELLNEFCPPKGKEMSQLWRSKQLEYSFRQTAMGFYKGFDFCTETALEYVFTTFNEKLSLTRKKTLLNSYKKLPIFTDTIDGLQELSGNNLYAFSNGVSSDLKQLLDYNNISHLLNGIVSVESTRHFKPSPETYSSFNNQTSSIKEKTILVSSNSFDIIGAAHYGFKTIWVKRDKQNIFDNWGIKPDFTIKNLTEIKHIII